MERLSLPIVLLVLFGALFWTSAATADDVVQLEFAMSAVVDEVWAGEISGDFDADLAVSLLTSHTFGPLEFVEFVWIVDAVDPAQSFTARLSGILFTPTGDLVTVGSVTFGNHYGASVLQLGRLIDGEGSTFEGTMTIIAATGGGRDEECEETSGPFNAVVVPPPACTSPFGLCTSGTLEGDLEGSYEFTAVSDMVGFPVAEFYGESIINLAGGQTLFAFDTVSIDLVTGQFVTVVTIVGGTGDLERATGQIVATGVTDLETISGSYTGEICMGD